MKQECRHAKGSEHATIKSSGSHAFSPMMYVLMGSEKKWSAHAQIAAGTWDNRIPDIRTEESDLFLFEPSATSLEMPDCIPPVQAERQSAKIGKTS